MTSACNINEERDSLRPRFTRYIHFCMMQMDPQRTLFGNNSDEQPPEGTIPNSLSSSSWNRAGGCERRHSRTLMKRALETLHDEDSFSRSTTNSSSMCRGSLGVTSSSDDDDMDVASPLRAARVEGSKGPRHSIHQCQASSMPTGGLSALVDRSLTTRRHSVLLDQMLSSSSPSAACAQVVLSSATPAPNDSARRSSSLHVSGGQFSHLGQDSPAGRCSTDVRLSRHSDSLMKISRTLSEAPSSLSPSDAKIPYYQRELFRPFEDDEQSARFAAASATHPSPHQTPQSPSNNNNHHSSLDWSAILQRCHEAKALIAMDQEVPRDLLDSASSITDIQQFGCGITSSFSFYLSSGSTSSDNSQSLALSSQSDEAADAALQGTLDAILT